MTEQDKERCREEIVNRGWNRVGQIAPEPDIVLWNKDEEVLMQRVVFHWKTIYHIVCHGTKSIL